MKSKSILSNIIEYNTYIEKAATELQNGIINKNPGLVSHIADNETYMYRDKNWMCNNCFYKSRCDMIRLEAGEIVGEMSNEILAQLREHFRKPHQ